MTSIDSVKTGHSFSPFVSRHIGPSDNEILEMLQVLGFSSLDELTSTVVPASIRIEGEMAIPSGIGEEEALNELRKIASRNRVFRSFIGQGYYGSFLPKVIERGVLENPAWYTAYTPYQPEISQGRLELLFYFQTLVCELTGMEICGASLLDEATAAAEAMTMAKRHHSNPKACRFLVSQSCHPQTLALIQTRAEPLGIQVVHFDESTIDIEWDDIFAVMVQYPATDGCVAHFQRLTELARQQGALVIFATDLLALTMLKSPRSLGADIVIGSAQRFGIPMGFGGPHAAFLATLEPFKRILPGRLVGQSIDARGEPAYRLALQTREQHIRREKATSNICTAQALLAMLSTLYAIYHGPVGLRAIAERVHWQTRRLAQSIRRAGFSLRHSNFFDTIAVECGSEASSIHRKAVERGYNLRPIDDTTVGVSLDETTSEQDLTVIAEIFSANLAKDEIGSVIDDALLRRDAYLTQAVFHQYRSETEMMRYLRRLADRDIALDRSMIPLGSCTMKLNAASELSPISWPEFSSIHPLAPEDQWVGYREMIEQLEQMLCQVTGYDAVSLQPNAGAQGEYAGLLAIRQYHFSRGDMQRDICLIPSSAHGTNPASAQMCNMQVVVVKCDEEGNVDLVDLRNKIAAYPDRIAAIMITYPSTHGVFEELVTEVCDLVHQAGGQVYIDGANLNALVGIAQPGKFGGDVSHLNLHKTFCIPHGGGGPGVGPVAVKSHLAPFLPRDGRDNGRQGPLVSAAYFGSAGILPISWMYIRMMGAAGLRRATQVAILNANYIARRLSDKYQILYKGNRGLVAHECIIDTRILSSEGGVTAEDIAKRLIDYGFHAPTMSFPVAGTLMIEPTESESKVELDRFIRALSLIYSEYENVLSGVWPKENNPLHNAPHCLAAILEADDMPYSRTLAACPDPEANPKDKYFPPVARVNNVFGDRNLVCSCPPISSYQESVCEAVAAVETAS